MITIMDLVVDIRCLFMAIYFNKLSPEVVKNTLVG